MNVTISTRNLCREFGRTKALDGVDLDVPEGAIYALVGANGAGKTTLIKVLVNIFHASRGWARVLDIDSRKVTGKVFQRIGYVSENQEMPEWMTTGGMLEYYRQFYPGWDLSLEHQLVRQFELPLHRKLKHLSRGMRMKAAFASSLAYRPALLILDEPFSGLDPLVRDELIEGLIERAPETTIFLSSHDLAEIESFSSHVGFLDRGRLRFSEELTILTERFREVTITLTGRLTLPKAHPSSWLQFEAVDSVVRFVHSNYNESGTKGELASYFPEARDIALYPMSLRAIFLSLAKAGRSQESSGSLVLSDSTEKQA
jgi:ABC-2 type transport system ATP-binding protein